MRRIVFAVFFVLFFAVRSYASDFPAKEVYMKYSPSVVVIKATREAGGGSMGTGSIITNEGLVITNAHVIINKEENKPYPKVGVFIKPPKIAGAPTDILNKYYEVEILKYDIPLDLAVLKIKNYDLKVSMIEFADPDQIDIGEDVIAIGHPEQGGFWTLTYGRISAEHKDYQGVAGKDMYQTDTSVNRGNSGGPLLDRRGYMVAVNSNIARLSKDGLPITGINYSIKSSVVKKWLNNNGYNVAYGKKPLVEEVKVAKLPPVEEKKTSPVADEKKPVPAVEEKKPEPAKEKPEVKQAKVEEKKPAPVKKTAAKKTETEQRFETPINPYDYDAILKAAEKDLDDMMEEMKNKFRR